MYQRQTVVDLLAKDEFFERYEFFKKTLDIDILQFFKETEKGLEFEQSSFFKVVLGATLRGYKENSAQLFATDLDVDAYVQSLSDEDSKKVPSLVFNRLQLHEIKTARGEDIQKWLQENLKNASDQLIKQSKSSVGHTDLAQIIASNELLALNTGFADGMVAYAACSPMIVPLAFRGTGVVDMIATAIAANPVGALTVIGIAVLIGAILVAICSLERELSCLMVNDTDYDVYIEDIYMAHGSMVAMVDDKTAQPHTIPKRKAENMVYGSFYTIQKNFGFYGAESTMCLKFINPFKKIYFMSANPLSCDSRLGLQQNRHSSSKDMHDILYNNGSISESAQYGGIMLAANLNSAHGAKAYAVNYISQVLDEFVNFDTETPTNSDFIRVKGIKNAKFVSARHCYAIGQDGEIACALAGRDRGHKLIVSLAADPGQPQVAVEVLYGREKIADLVLKKAVFETFTIVVPDYVMQRIESNEEPVVAIRHVGAGELFIKRLAVQKYIDPSVLSDWMGELPDSIRLEDINIPGTHDSAAINTYTHTVYACHYATITEQLNGGIRCLDVRIKVKEQNEQIVFVTCHGAIGGQTTLNEFQSLRSLLDECAGFLRAHSTETIVMSLKIDDWRVAELKQYQAMDELRFILEAYPTKSNYQRLGTLGEARGKIVLLNRINEDIRLGAPMFWTQNTKKEYAQDTWDSPVLKHRYFKILVQDKFQFAIETDPEQKKLELVIEMFKEKSANDGKVVLNYASACKYGAVGVYIHKKLLAYFGKEKHLRPSKLGWIMLDYAFDRYKTDVYGSMDIVDIIVASNFGYLGFEHSFRLAAEHVEL